MSRAIEGFTKSAVEPFQASPASAPTLTPAQNEAQQALAQERFRREATAVSHEKNKFADSQLSLYAFLNIVGVGLIIYIAGATR
jgi:hypothetical protein